MGSRKQTAFSAPPVDAIECILSRCTAAEAAKLSCVCKAWRALHVQATFSAWFHPPLDVIECILSRCSATEAARLGCVCKTWRAVLMRATQFHAWGHAESSTRQIESPMLTLNMQPLWSQRGGLMPAAGNQWAQKASLVRCAKHLQASIANACCDLPLQEALSLISRTLGDEVAHLVHEVMSCHDFSQHMVARSPGLEQAASGAHEAARAAQATAAGAAAVASVGGPLAAATAAAAQAAKQAANTAATAAAAAYGALAALTAVDPWGFWTALMLGMLCARNAHGVPSLASELWSMTELSGHASSAPRISRAQVRELLSAVILLSRHEETGGLNYAYHLKPLHDMLLASTLYLESIDAHRALAGMQSHKILKGIALPAPAYHLDTKGKPMTKEQVNIIQNVLSPFKPLPDVVHRITAFAGSGKTHTLRLLASAYPSLKILYLTFNRDDDPLASEKDNKGFPSNVVRQTTCSIARKETQAMGNFEEPRKKVVRDFLERRLGHSLNYKVVDVVLGTANAWMMSSDPELSEEHVRKGEVCELKPEFRALDFVKLAKALYDAMIDPHCHEISMTHSTYLKKFVLSGAEITCKSGGPFDAILLDEAQDVNMVTLQMLLAQPGTKVLCGDPNQHIYSFNGCCDTLSPTGPFKDLTQGSAAAEVVAGGASSQQPAMQPPTVQPPTQQQQQQQQGHPTIPIPCLRTMVQRQYSQGLSLTLTTSFRLGPEIAHVASRLLTECCHDTRPLLGMGSADAVVFAPEVQNGVVRRFQQMPLLSTRINEGYPGEVSCIPIQLSSKALVLWRRSVAAPQSLLPTPVPDFTPPALLPNTEAPLLYLARTNLGWFAAAVAIAENGMKFYVDQQKYNDLCRRIRSVEALCTRNQVEDCGLWAYFDQRGSYFSTLKLDQAAENGVIDAEWGRAFKVYQAWREQTIKTLELVASCKVVHKHEAPFWLSTVHKVKGLETPYVQLSNDFIKLSRPDDRKRKPDDDTYLLYVAATRATRMLLINSDLCWVKSPSVPQEPCPYLEVLGQDEGSEMSTQLMPPTFSMSLLDVRQLHPLEFQALSCSTTLPPTSPHSPLATLDCTTDGPWHRHREGARVSVCCRYSYPPPGESYQMCSACARASLFGDLWGAC